MKCTAYQQVDSGGTLGSGLSRRDFVKICSAAAVYMGLDASLGATIAEAAAAKPRGPREPPGGLQGL